MPERRHTAYEIPGNFSLGKTFFLGDSDATLGIVAQDEGTGVETESGYGLDAMRPFATHAYMINSNVLVAGRGDTVYIVPGTAIDLTAAGGLSFSRSDVRYVGMGRNNRPIITCSGTDDATDLNITGAGCWFENLTFDMTGNDSVTAFIDLDAADVTFKNCRFLLADSGGQVDIGVDIGADSDRVQFIDCDFIGDTAASFGISVSGACTDLALYRCRFDIVGSTGAGGLCCVDFLAACTRFYAEDCFFANRVASATATVDCNGQAVTGAMVRCYHQLGTIATAGSGIIPVVSDTPEAYIASFENYVVNDQGGAGIAGEAGALVGTAST